MSIAFDLWDTLVPLPLDAKRAAFTETSCVLGVPEGRMSWTSAQLDGVEDARRAHDGSCFREPRPDAVDTLRALRASGIQVAVLSNGTSDVRDMFRSRSSHPSCRSWSCLRRSA